jgi:hypothetical protein
MITLSGTSAYLFAPPGCSLRGSSAVQVKPAPNGGPVTHTRQLLPAGPHLLPRKSSETGTGQLGTRLAPLNSSICRLADTKRSGTCCARGLTASSVATSGSRSRVAIRGRARGDARSGAASVHYDRYGRTLYPTRRARRVQRWRQRGRRTPRVLARGTTGGRDARR